MPTLARKYFGLKQLRPITLRPENQIFQKCHFASSIGMPQGEIKAIIINIIRPGNKLENLHCKSNHQFNLYNPAFSIKAHFLIWSYQACNNIYKLATCMFTNLALKQIKLLKIKSFHQMYFQKYVL